MRKILMLFLLLPLSICAASAELNIEAKVKTVINNSFKIEQGAKIIIK